MCREHIEDVIEHFPDAIKAEKKDRNVLVLWKLDEPWVDDYDGQSYDYELAYKWLSNDDVHCVLGQETIFTKDVNLNKSLFDRFILY